MEHKRLITGGINISTYAKSVADWSKSGNAHWRKRVVEGRIDQAQTAVFRISGEYGYVTGMLISHVHESTVFTDVKVSGPLAMNGGETHSI